MPKFSRRDLFKAFSAGTLLIPVSYAVGVSFGGYPERQGLKFLTDKEAAILESVTEVVIPNDTAIGIPPAEIDIIHRLDEFIGIMPAHGQSRVRLLLWTVEHVFPIRIPFFRKFTRLNIEGRTRILQKFDQNGGVGGRALVRALKALIQNAYYNHPEVSKRIEFVGRCET